MKITSVTPHYFQMPLREPIADARNVIRARSTLLVRVDTDAGISGWGEAASFAGCGPLVAQAIRFLATAIIGKDPRDAAKIYHERFSATLHFGRRGVVINALSGIDVALWDIVGKAAGKPLRDLLPGEPKDVAFYFNGGYFVESDPEGFLRRSVEQAVSRGANALKIKIGKGVEDDVKRIEIARNILSGDRDLMVDANGVLDLDYCRELAPVLDEYAIRWIEEPIPIEPASAMADVYAALGTPIAGYELEQTADGWRRLMDPKVIDIAQPDAIWSGGITECVTVAKDAASLGIEFVPHNFASIICLAANAHLASTAASGGTLEVDSNDNPFLWNLDPDGFGLANGHIVFPDRPGLGVEPDLSLIENYRINI